VGKEAFLYWVKPIPCDYGTAFELEKFSDETVYHVNIGGEDGHPSCECAGHLRWGHRTTCKHIASLTALVAAGRI
jgi:hypothetical protein